VPDDQDTRDGGDGDAAAEEEALHRLADHTHSPIFV
jgi:hypothetical protein